MEDPTQEPSAPKPRQLSFGEVAAVTTRAAKLVREGHRPGVAAAAALEFVDRCCLCTACGLDVRPPGECDGSRTCKHCGSQVMHRVTASWTEPETA